MRELIETVFKIIAVGFDKIPLLKKMEGYRSVAGFLGLGIVAILKMQGIIEQDTASQVSVGLIAFTGLALNSKGR